MKSEGYKIFIEKKKAEELQILDKLFALLVFLWGLDTVILWRLLASNAGVT